MPAEIIFCQPAFSLFAPAAIFAHRGEPPCGFAATGMK
jgi:hypothetical protein